jgi:hypothetical protein
MGDIKGAAREYAQKQIHKEVKISDWVGIQDGTEKARTDHAKAFWGSGTKQTVRKNVHKARYGRWATRATLHLWGLSTSPCCALCDSGLAETPAHLLLACTHPEIKAQQIARHNGAVKKVAKALKRGSKGGSEVRWDPGGLKKVRCKYTATPGMLTWPPLQHVDHEFSDFQYPVGVDALGEAYTPSNPDLIMVERERQDGWDDAEVVRKSRGKKEGEEGANHLKGRMWIIEVTFAWDSKWEIRAEEKVEKYRPLVEQLEKVGWEVEFRAVVLGVTGLSRGLFTSDQIRGLGLTRTSCRLLEQNIARSSWGYVRSLWVSRCIAFSAWEAGEVAGGAGGAGAAGGARRPGGAGRGGGAGVGIINDGRTG